MSTTEAMPAEAAPTEDSCPPQLYVAVQATPVATNVPPGTLVQLEGTSERYAYADVGKTCLFLKAEPVPVPFTWSLAFVPPDGAATDATDELLAADTLNPRFVAASEGHYKVKLRGSDQYDTEIAWHAVDVVPGPPVRLWKTGRISYLRVQNPDEPTFGTEPDAIVAEAIIRLDTEPNQAYGFALRDDPPLPAPPLPTRQGMLDVLRDAFFRRHPVTVEVSIVPGRHTGYLNMVLVRPLPPTIPGPPPEG